MEKLVKMIQDKMKGFDPRPPANQQLDLDEDMNKLDDMELNKRKALMNEEFEANRVKPGDQEFLYDKEVEFDAGKMESGWDDDEDYSDPEFWAYFYIKMAIIVNLNNNNNKATLFRMSRPLT